MEPRLSNGISPGFILVCKIFRAHEMCSQLEVTEMLECKVNLTV